MDRIARIWAVQKGTGLPTCCADRRMRGPDGAVFRFLRGFSVILPPRDTARIRSAQVIFLAEYFILEYFTIVSQNPKNKYEVKHPKIITIPTTSTFGVAVVVFYVHTPYAVEVKDLALTYISR